MIKLFKLVNGDEFFAEEPVGNVYTNPLSLAITEQGAQFLPYPMFTNTEKTIEVKPEYVILSVEAVEKLSEGYKSQFQKIIMPSGPKLFTGEE